MKDIEKIFYELEVNLLPQNACKCAGRAAELLHDDFTEYGSSGRVYLKNDVVQCFQTTVDGLVRITDFSASMLSGGVVMCKYHAEKSPAGSTEIKSRSLRSSIWILTDDKWQLYFHQGTQIQNN